VHGLNVYYVFRVWFGETFHPRDAIVDTLNELGALIEWSSQNLLAVDAADKQHALVIAEFLDKSEKAGQFIYETGRSLWANNNKISLDVYGPKFQR
jgi:hypothetical protein